MLCFLCGKKIGLWRKLVDQQYCSAAHRKEAKLASAQAFREEDELEHWSVARSKKKKKGSARPAASAGQTASIFASRTRARIGISTGIAGSLDKARPGGPHGGRGGGFGA